jgi:hypothetical protein
MSNYQPNRAVRGAAWPGGSTRPLPPGQVRPGRRRHPRPARRPLRDLELTDTATLLKDLGRKNLPDIKPSETLIALIDADPIIPPKKKT